MAKSRYTQTRARGPGSLALRLRSGTHPASSALWSGLQVLQVLGAGALGWASEALGSPLADGGLPIPGRPAPTHRLGPSDRAPPLGWDLDHAGLPPPWVWHRYGNLQMLPSPTANPMQLRRYWNLLSHWGLSSSKLSTRRPEPGAWAMLPVTQGAGTGWAPHWTPARAQLAGAQLELGGGSSPSSGMFAHLFKGAQLIGNSDWFLSDSGDPSPWPTSPSPMNGLACCQHSGLCSQDCRTPRQVTLGLWKRSAVCPWLCS